MAQKLLIGGLVLGIALVIGFGLIDAGQMPQNPEPIVLAENVTTINPVTPVPTAAIVPPTIVPAMEMTVEPTIVPPSEVIANPDPVVLAQGAMGDPWQADGTVGAVDDFGFTLMTVKGDYFVELGPPTYWQAQGVALAAGDPVSVDGYYNGEQVHARVVSVGDAQLVVRSESGQPMWAGGADHSTTGNQQGAGGMTPQVVPGDWLTLTGVIGSVTNGQVTLNVNDGTVITLQMGRPDFWQSQGITLAVGDPVEVLGFWSGDQFMAGDIRKTATGETIMLRDPNGRQLWSGPGRNGQGQTGANGQGQTGGNGQQQGGGNQYRGGREG